MSALLKPTSRPVKEYYDSLRHFEAIDVSHEGAVRDAFQTLLKVCGRRLNWTLVAEHRMMGSQNRRISIDGALLDDFKIAHGYWEAKDMHDDLPNAVLDKFRKGYPRDNIIFQIPKRAILWQNKQQVLDADLTDARQLIEAVETFFDYRPEEQVEWEKAVAEFKEVVPVLGDGLAKLIRGERETNRRFARTFGDFHEKCRQSINANLSEAAVEEMLTQHLLTERLFRTVFNNPDFTRRNVIANEIEKVIDALTSQSFTRDSFLQSLDRFYAAIERNAARITDFSQKQGFLNTVYEQFFQGFSVKVADTHGIVYTPQPIVDFMVKSVEEILKSEFNRSISDSGVHIVDPFVGTGNFIVRIIEEIQRPALEDKYTSELHCNEVMLLPYYIASMNIEHQFYEVTGHYQSFEGICLVDTFELAEDRQYPLFVPENAQRVESQKETPMFVVIGNPPYNVGQVNENDNNKNRKYSAMDKRVKETYAADSTATNKNQLSDPYVKAIRWASDRIGDEGVVAFVTNNAFLDGVAFDGMRKHLNQDFNCVYILDLKGNVRKDSMREGIPIGEKHTVFGLAAMVGIAVTFFVKSRGNEDHKIYYSEVDWKATRREKFNVVEKARSVNNIEWKELTPNENHTWLTEGLHAEFETYVPMGNKATKAAKSAGVDAIFKTYSGGVKTNRDAWAYNFNRNILTENMSGMIDTYNMQVFKWQHQENRNANFPDDEVDDFVVYDDSKISWSSGLKHKLKGGNIAKFAGAKIRRSLYRPFTKSNLYFDRVMIERAYLFPSMFPTPGTEAENGAICVSGLGSSKPFHTLMVEMIPCFDLLEKTQCFSFYTYDEDGNNRRENITDWALTQFRTNYLDDKIDKWGIFHYVYALLHHPDYREQYAANLKRNLPHLPYVPDFWGFAKAGKRLAQIHAGYDNVPEYEGGNGESSLRLVANEEVPFSWRVEKMRLSKDKTQVIYNDSLIIDGIPAKAFEYRLGNRSALEWTIDQYRVKTDKRSGIVNDPNRPDDPRYIVKLIQKVITVSLETVEIVKGLPALRTSD